MTSKTLKGRWLMAPALFFAFCSTGDSPALTSPSNSPGSAVTANGGLVGASAVGDVKVGTGAIEIIRLRMDRQTSSGASILRQYANPGGVYPMNPGETIELWAEWDRASVPRNPRFIVNWGEGETDFTGCGSCMLKHTYNIDALFTVTAKLDDMSGTVVTRTFTLDSRQPAPTPTPTPTASPKGVYVGALGATEFWKVQAAGTMTDTKCFDTCKAAGLSVGCQAGPAQNSCQYNDNVCTVTPETSCGNPMYILASQLCADSPDGCAPLIGVYQYMGHKWQSDSTCGAETGRWCSAGQSETNKFCMCVR